MTSDTATHFYDHPAWYDIIHANGTAWEVDFLQRLSYRHGYGGRDWLEPACGTARYLRVLAKRGYHVVGYDINERSLKYAKSRLKQFGDAAEILKDDMCTFCRPCEFDIAFNTINTFRHIMNHDDADHHMQLIAQSLRPGGIYILGMDLVDYSDPEPCEEIWDAKRGKCNVQHIMMSIPPTLDNRNERIINHITVTTPSREHAFQSAYDLLTYNVDECNALIDRSPFELLATYDFAHQPVEMDAYARDVNMVLRVPQSAK